MKSNDTSARSPVKMHVHASASAEPIVPQKFHFKDMTRLFREYQERRRQAGKLVLSDTFLAGRNKKHI